MNQGNEQIREALSALADGELDGAEVDHAVEATAGDDALRRAWARYHLGGDALRRALPDAGGTDVADRVRAALRAEPAPARAGAAARVRRAGTGPLARALRPAVGLALAASVAVVAVIALREAREPELAPPPVASVAPVAEQGAPGGVQAVAKLRWNVDRPALEERLNGYLVNHSEHQHGGIHGMLPYARVVAYDARP